ncbi:MAG: efflux RND transporter periplasmic adaptor subunit [Pseudomonadota bacterium]
MPDEDLSRLRIDRSGNAPASARPASRSWLRPALVAAAALIGVAIFFGIGEQAQTVETARVGRAYPSQGVALLNAAGYVVAQRKAAVASKGTGRLEWLGVREGSVAKKDEVIARLENNDVMASQEQAAASVRVARANRAQAEAELRDAASALQRARELAAREFLSPSALDAAVARHDKALAAVNSQKSALAAAQAALDAARVAVSYTQIRAPFDGVVLSKHANVGDVITPFTSATDAKGAVVTMADMSTLEVEADVSESNLLKVKVGQPCEIQLDAIPEERFRGVVQSIVPTVDRSKATVMVKIRFVDQDARILPEMSAKAAFLSRPIADRERKPLTAVNAAAIVSRKGESVVFRVEAGRARRVKVTTGERIGDMLEIRQGLAFGDTVVLKPSPKIEDGDKIRVAEK